MNCLVCSSSTQCSECEDGYYLDSSQQCVSREQCEQDRTYHF